MQNHPQLYGPNLSKDLPAGLVVFLVALPLCLGISLASGAPPLAGIITGIIGGLVVSWLSGSSLSVSGPAAGLTVIVLDGIKELKTFETFLLAGFLAGVIQLVLGFAKAGVIGMYFPSSVIRGMLAAIGLTLILKQVSHLVGYDKDAMSDDPFILSDGTNGLSFLSNISENFQMGSLFIGLISLAILILWDSKPIKKIAALKLVPGALIVVIASVFLNVFFSSIRPAWAIADTHLVNLPIFGSLGAIGDVLRFPAWSQIGNPAVYVVAFTIAIIASLETLLSVEAVDKIDPHRRITPPNRELKAQGVGNMLASLIGGIPMTAVIVRSSANVDAGGQTRISSAFHGLLLLLSVLFLARYINMVPLSALAAVLLMVGYKLTKPSLYRQQWRLGANQFIPFIVTIIAVLATDLLIGVGIGLLFGMFFILKANYESSHYLHEERHMDEHVIRIELSENVSFLNKASISRVLDDLPDGNKVIIDGSNSNFIDYDVLEAIQNFRTSAADRNIEVELVNVPEVVALAH
ncbi:MAG TPA: SulP family inorganic anion transporter [Abditibacterium sp.]